jgi:CheY-like chemotaxis protein
LSAQKAEVEEAHKDAEEKAAQLAEASKYKSEFMANMSHELRTPLNSLLILSKMLADNTEGNLTENQVEDAKIIHEGGQDLLELINDIMDLSKVEAGMLEIHDEDLSLSDIARNMQSLFGPLAENKGLEFVIEQDERLPRHLKSDGQRIQQVLKNFLSNAFKFTDAGEVSLSIRPSTETTIFTRPDLSSGNTIALSVRDSGIGIAEDKLQDIFEAFRQEDGSTSRKYGGTGLGLSISTNLAQLLGGEIQVESIKGEGSCFTLYLPRVEFEGLTIGDQSVEETPIAATSTPLPSAPAAGQQNTPSMDHGASEQEDHILIVEDDAVFANVLKNAAEKQGFTSSVTASGHEALYFAIEKQPSCILLDIGLPDMNGIDVLAQLKTHEATVSIPVNVISADDHEAASLGRGAVDFLMKPATGGDVASLFRRIETSESQKTTVLLVEDDSGQRSAVKRLLQDTSSAITTADSGKKALTLLSEVKFDCMILDIGLPDMDGFEVIENIAEWPVEDRPAIIVHTARDLTDHEMKRIASVTSDVIVKGPQSGDQLLNDLSRFFETVASQNDMPDDLGTATTDVLEGKHLLIVDDDMRNVFALSRQLGGLGLEVSIAEDGQKALEFLEEAAEEKEQIDMILMDIMMPVMDGYEAMPLIRQMPAYTDTPMLALTANAMPEDREKCLQAGASDYLSKPVDMDRLVAMLRVWMHP